MTRLSLALLLALTTALPASAQTETAPLPSPLDTAAPTPAETAAAAASQAAASLRDATQRLDQALTADDQVVALGDVIRSYEEGQAALRQGLRQASAREDQIAAGFDSRRATLGQALGIMAGIGRAPEATLLMHPGGPEQTARAGMVLASITPALKAEAQSVRADLAEIATVRAAQDEAAQTLAAGLGRVQQARQLLASAVADRSTLPTRFLDNPEELRQLAASAESLDSFAQGVAVLEADVNAPPSDFAGAEGGLPLPVVGTVLRGYNQPDKAGVRRPGVVLATAPRALVTAPWPATIRYRGPLLDYGNVIILEPARGYLLVFAGLAQVFGETGDVVASGEPVGLMGGSEGTPPEFGVNFVVDASRGTTDATGIETLYVELRKGKETLDPEAWFVIDQAVVGTAKTATTQSEADANDGLEEGDGTGGDTQVAPANNGTDE